MPPVSGGMESQPWIWKHALDTVYDAREWAESLQRAESDLEQTQHSYDSAGDDAGHEQEKQLKEVADHYYKAHEQHAELIKNMRRWWHDDPDYIEPEEAEKQEEERDAEREFWRQIKQMEEGSDTS